MLSWERNIRRPLHHAYLRITLSRITLSFFMLSFSFTFVQGMIQAFLWAGDQSTSSVVSSILEQGNVSTSFLPWLSIKHNDYNLKICSVAPYGAEDVDAICTTVFDSAGNHSQSARGLSLGSRSNVEVTTGGSGAGVEYARIGDSILINGRTTPTDVFDTFALRSLPRDDTQQLMPLAVTVSLANDNRVSTLSAQCAQVLLYPAHRFRDSMDEELALIFSQFWLLGISSAAVLSRSVSHILAVFSMRVLATGWSAYTLWRTEDLRIRINHLVVNPDTPCHTDLFPGYFNTRLLFQIPDLLLNLGALLFTTILGWRLYKTFSQNTFNCVGPPSNIIRLYRYLLTVIVTEQLLLYTVLTSMALAMKEGAITKARLFALDISLFIASVILLPIMLIIGYRAARYEKKGLMIAFLVLLTLFLSGFGFMFTLDAFRFTWIQWPFFACVSGLAGAQLSCCIAFAVVCRYHFGKGLSHYLHVEKVLSDYDFQPDKFSTSEHTEVREPNRLSAAVAMSTVPVLKRDTTWDFVNVDLGRTRPPVYTVELTG